MTEGWEVKRTEEVFESPTAQALRTLRSVQESFQILFDAKLCPIPQDSIAMGCVKGVFIGVPKQVDAAIAALTAGGPGG